MVQLGVGADSWGSGCRLLRRRDTGIPSFGSARQARPGTPKRRHASSQRTAACLNLARAAIDDPRAESDATLRRQPPPLRSVFCFRSLPRCRSAFRPQRKTRRAGRLSADQHAPRIRSCMNASFRGCVEHTSRLSSCACSQPPNERTRGGVGITSCACTDDALFTLQQAQCVALRHQAATSQQARAHHAAARGRTGYQRTPLIICKGSRPVRRSQQGRMRHGPRSFSRPSVQPAGRVCLLLGMLHAVGERITVPASVHRRIQDSNGRCGDVMLCRAMVTDGLFCFVLFCFDLHGWISCGDDRRWIVAGIR